VPLPVYRPCVLRAMGEATAEGRGSKAEGGLVGMVVYDVGDPGMGHGHSWRDLQSGPFARRGTTDLERRTYAPRECR
jgi:hypothetical protein